MTDPDILLADMKATLERIDERTLNTHDLVRAHIDRADIVHDTLHSRISGLARTVYLTGGGLSVGAAGVAAWVKGLFSG